MRELQTEYEGQVEFVIVPAEETATRAEEIASYELGSHGLVVFDAEGEPRASLPGHSFGKSEILAAIVKVQAGG